MSDPVAERLRVEASHWTPESFYGKAIIELLRTAADRLDAYEEALVEVGLLPLLP